LSIKVVIDMNLSPEWAGLLSEMGWPAVHWSSVGNADAPDAAIMEWAATNSHVVFTHDLDFGASLALTRATSPSVKATPAKVAKPARLSKRASSAK